MKIIDNSQVQYPTKKIVSCYLLFGGVIGGILLTPNMILVDLYRNTITLADIDVNYIVNFLPWFLLLGGTGFFWGFLPALFTAVVVVRQKILLTSYQNYVILFLVGCISSCLVSFTLAIIFQSWLILLAISTAGGLSALIVGYFVIPKS